MTEIIICGHCEGEVSIIGPDLTKHCTTCEMVDGDTYKLNVESTELMGVAEALDRQAETRAQKDLVSRVTTWKDNQATLIGTMHRTFDNPPSEEDVIFMDRIIEYFKKD